MNLAIWIAAAILAFILIAVAIGKGLAACSPINTPRERPEERG